MQAAERLFEAVLIGPQARCTVGCRSQGTRDPLGLEPGLFQAPPQDLFMLSPVSCEAGPRVGLGFRRETEVEWQPPDCPLWWGPQVQAVQHACGVGSQDGQVGAHWFSVKSCESEASERAASRPPQGPQLCPADPAALAVTSGVSEPP